MHSFKLAEALLARYVLSVHTDTHKEDKLNINLTYTLSYLTAVAHFKLSVTEHSSPL